MDPHVRLPWELEEEILSRLPPKSIVRFSSVCKQWNSLLDDRSFVYKHLSLPRPQFILLTKFNIYSIDITDPTMELRKIHSSYDERSLNWYNTNITTCDEFLFCNYPGHWKKVPALWNPWLRQVNWIKLFVDKYFDVYGLGYDNTGPKKVHKMLGYLKCTPEVQTNSYPQRLAIYECASHVLRFIDTHDEDRPISVTAKRSHVSLNGNLYWIDYDRQTREYFIQSFDFSKETFKPFCLLPFQENPSCDERILAVFKGDRFSLLNQCFLTRKIDIWVTKRKIDDREDVVWVNLMTLTATNLPKLFNKLSGVSYFIYDDKTLFMCCDDDETEKPCIYTVKRDICKKSQIGGQIGWFSHCAYVPNWISVPLDFQIG